MRLKSVRLFGFKTFAEPTEFNLAGGVVAVVGPNGCGKSNLVDAILWGLGESNARHLRAGNSQEIIFSGSSRRKGLGYCEVTLLFDNEDRTLPIESPEVSISRRLTRGDDSEYFINRRPCRQRDIVELLADSGLGRTGYSIIGQRQIDSALMASSEERRSWIDEAAGVQRYRQRKIEAQRKLDTAAAHLVRVADVLIELDSQRDPLREQAREAENYRRVQTTLRDLEVRFLSVEVAEAARKEAAALDQIGLASKLFAAETVLVGSHQARAAALSNETRLLDQSIEHSAEEEKQRLLDLERSKSQILLHRSRLDSLRSQENNQESDRQAAQTRLAEAEAEHRRAQEEHRGDEEALAAIRSLAGGTTQEVQRLGRTLAQAEADLKAALQREAQRVRREFERKTLLERRSLAKRESDSLTLALPGLEANAGQARAALDALHAQASNEKEKTKQILTQQLRLRELEDLDATALRAALAERAALEGRERGIEETVQALEGVSQGARAVIEAANQGRLEGEFTLVSQAIQTDPEFATAIEAALGGAVNDLIVATGNDSKRAIEYLKRHHAGRATFQPIALMRDDSFPAELRALLARPGVLGSADSLVQHEPRFRRVIQSLLGRTLLVQNLDVALGLATTRGWSKLVTLDGEIVFARGAVTGGKNARQTYGMVQRKADLVTIRKQADGLTEKIDRFHQNSAERQRTSSELEAEGKLVRTRVAELEDLISEARSLCSIVDDELRSALRDQVRLKKDLDQPIPEAEAVAEPLAHLENERDRALHALAEKSADAKSFEDRLREGAQRVTKSFTRMEFAAKKLLQERRSEAQFDQRREHVVLERQKIGDEIRLEEERLADLNLKAEAAKQSTEFQRTLRKQKAEQIEQETLAATTASKSAADASAALHQAELDRTRADTRRQAALARLAEEYSIFESALPSNSNPPPTDAPTLISHLKKELRSMGDVNMGAIEAYHRLTERFENLDRQRQDIEGGIREIREGIAQLDNLTRDKFQEALTAVQAAFSETFSRLFEGGVGSIELSDRSDLLESGIEIHVVLPGKRRQPLTLLSGGEQSLCTAAFLFALLKVKSSPLVVLDEVDAPLDGRNVQRFAELLRELSSSMQFIVITHNPVTIESSDIWLGISMQEPGVSKLIQVKPPVPTKSLYSGAS